MGGAPQRTRRGPSRLPPPGLSSIRVDYFARLGAWLEERWCAHRRDERTFPGLAVEAPETFPAARELDLDALFDTILDPAQPALGQLAPLGVFGQPAYTAYQRYGEARTAGREGEVRAYCRRSMLGALAR